MLLTQVDGSGGSVNVSSGNGTKVLVWDPKPFSRKRSDTEMGMMEMIKSLQAKNKEQEEQLEIIEKQRE